MKLISCLDKKNKIHFGIIYNEDIYIHIEHRCWNDWFKYILEIVNNKISIDFNVFNKVSESEIQLISPIQEPTSLRDAYAFRKHVESGRKSRGLEMIPEYDEFPVYYYSNHNAIIGGGIVDVESSHMKHLDFELEIAAIIGKKGKNIRVNEADSYILGYSIMNDFSCRHIQKKEMKLNLGPAKGKDFSTALGPYIITRDELETSLMKDEQGERYDLNMKAYLNDKLISEDNFKNMTWTFAQIISRVSQGTTILPGDIIGSGTCATGCLLELNQTNNTDIWLMNDDKITLNVDKMGSLESIIKTI